MTPLHVLAKKAKLIIEPPRIAVVYTHFPHYRAAVFDALDRSDSYSFEFYYDPRGIDATIESGAQSTAHRVLPLLRWGRFFWQRGSIALSGSRDIDGLIFLGNPLILSTWIAGVHARLRGKKTFFWTHGWLRRETGLKGILRKAFYRLADGLMVYGERAREIGMDAGFDPNHIHVVANSLDYDVQREAREAYDAHLEPRGEGVVHNDRPDTPYFLAVSRLVPSAELDLAIDAMAELPANAVLVIVGDGPERASLEVRACKSSVDVRFLGAVYDEPRLASLFINACAVISPGKVGLLAVHALAYGAPVITHDDFDRQMPEVEAIEPGVTGTLFRRGNRQSLVLAMQYYYGLQDDAPARATCRSSAIVRIERDFTPEAQVAKIIRALDAVFWEGR